ncbi:serine/threonine-protein kinase [Streptomyces sp. NPDC006553]|uniref:serine/threonine-protein kinase n=1 Tax=unclassified Streptomyces TaxID=2593676 RepID=UPI00225B0635|nr:serine/threonine-protein kinase [Streptomyces sp. NBC_00233]MCX5228462.1 serine/threonine protein kinase [Streptomyces sp. NBC_00233]
MQPCGPNDPSQVGPFRTVAVLGQGGMGRVLLGTAANGQLVAVKQVHADLADDAGFRSRFRREVDASRRVSGAYTAPVVEADPDAETPWLASLFLPGPSLSEAVAGSEAGTPAAVSGATSASAPGGLPEEAVRRLAAGLAQALADIHRAGLVHRDLKPSNVLLTDDGVRVIDFGIARAADQLTKLTHTGALIGSPAFMAPEQVRGEAPTPATDVFALGATLVVACTGTTPFSGTSVPALMYSIAHAEPVLDGVPAGLRGIVAACLAKDPALRPSPQEVLAMTGPVAPLRQPWPGAVQRRIAEQTAEIERLVGSMPTQAGPAAPLSVPAPAPVRRPRRQRRWIAAAVTAGTLAVTGAVFVATGWAAEMYYMVVPEPVPTPGNVPLNQVADTYTGTIPSCAEAGTALKRPPGFTPFPLKDGGPPTTSENGQSNQCTWNTRSGDEIVVIWDVYRSKKGGLTGAEQSKAHYEGMYMRGKTLRVSTLDFVEEALWYKPDGKYCVLYGRDVNAELFVLVKGTNYPLGTCEAVTEDLGKQAMAALKAKAKTPAKAAG